MITLRTHNKSYYSPMLEAVSTRTEIDGNSLNIEPGSNSKYFWHVWGQLLCHCGLPRAYWDEMTLTKECHKKASGIREDCLPGS